MASSDGPVAIVGAGLAGSLLAIFLRERGEDIILMDLRDDPRCESGGCAAGKGTPDAVAGGLALLASSSKRSINLALSSRGLRALRALGLADEVLRDSVTMAGRMIHSKSGQLELQPYGHCDEHVLHSVSRELMNRFLIERLNAPPKAGEGSVQMLFRHKVVSLSKDGSALTVEHSEASDETRTKTTTLRPRLVIGADGSFSVIRRELSKLCRLSVRHEYIAHGYLELSIPPLPNGQFALDPHALHIWPRHDFMLIALPNIDRSFTATLFASWELLAQLKDWAFGEGFFGEQFGDVLPLMTDLRQELSHNPRGALATVRCEPWHAAGRVLLIGDAAHAVVPFYGQGMNCAFEDCLELSEQLRDSHGDLAGALESFFESRKPACDALAELSLGNYVEMRSKTASRLFALQNRLHGLLHLCRPSWQPSLHSAVTFSEMPYHKARAQCEWQDSVLTGVLVASGVATACTCAVVCARLLGARHH